MRASDHPYFAPRFAALAHRGGFSSAVPEGLENTVEAFSAAISLGYRYLETDVHTTADGVLVAFHDDSLDRVTDRLGAIASLPYSEVAAARVGGGASIPTMDELLETFPQARFNIDLKADGSVEPLQRVLTRHNALERVCVGSFSTARLERFRKLSGPGVATSASPREIMLHRATSVLGFGVPMHGLAYQVPLEHRGVPLPTRAFIRAAHRAGRLVHVWTINDRSEMVRLIELGVGGLVTDDIETLRSVCQEYGIWEDR